MNSTAKPGDVLARDMTPCRCQRHNFFAVERFLCDQVVRRLRLAVLFVLAPLFFGLALPVAAALLSQ
jgi:hypothetical protein